MAILHHYRIRHRKLERLDTALQEVAQSLFQAYQDCPWKEKYKEWSVIPRFSKGHYFDWEVEDIKLKSYLHWRRSDLSYKAQKSVVAMERVLKDDRTGAWVACVVGTQKGLTDAELKKRLQYRKKKRGEVIELSEIHIHHQIEPESRLDFSAGIDSIMQSIVGQGMYKHLLEARLKKAAGKAKPTIKPKI